MRACTQGDCAWGRQVGRQVCSQVPQVDCARARFGPRHSLSHRAHTSDLFSVAIYSRLDFWAPWPRNRSVASLKQYASMRKSCSLRGRSRLLFWLRPPGATLIARGARERALVLNSFKLPGRPLACRAGILELPMQIYITTLITTLVVQPLYYYLLLSLLLYILYSEALYSLDDPQSLLLPSYIIRRLNYQ